MKLSIDIETYSSVSLTNCGVYPYTESPDFDILLFAYAFDDEPVKCVSFAEGEKLPAEVLNALADPNVTKHAYNAMFERVCLKVYLSRKYGWEIWEIEGREEFPIEQWRCTMVHAYMAGYSGRLGSVGKALGLSEDKAKLRSGKALIRYFSIPCKPTKVNGGRTRNLPEHNPEKWQEFKKYCSRDVEAEREIFRKIEAYSISNFERKLYVLDQEINDRGVLIDKTLVDNALECNKLYKTDLIKNAKKLTGIENPNSVAQLKKWIETYEGFSVPSINKDTLQEIVRKSKKPETIEMLKIRKELAKTSIKKYQAMSNCTRKDGRAGGLLQHYGASRTGRWAGRLVQVQNLPKNKMLDLDDARNFLLNGDYEALDIIYASVSDTLSQLIRTAFIAKKGHTFAVADFSAIEARIIAWLAGEKWRLDVFKTHGKIYEASAAAMFNVPLESIDKGSTLRQKGKVAELALGYGGSVGALITMGAIDMGLKENELKPLVNAWRAANRNITALWKILNNKAKYVISKSFSTSSTWEKSLKDIRMYCKNGDFRIVLPNGRELSYLKARVEKSKKFDGTTITYIGMNQDLHKLTRLETYGGKLTENIVQAIARDCLAHSMLRLKAEGYNIVMHVHDEVIIELPKKDAKKELENICAIMGESIPWAKDLLLRADGYITDYYLKD